VAGPVGHLWGEAPRSLAGPSALRRRLGPSSHASSRLHHASSPPKYLLAGCCKVQSNRMCPKSPSEAPQMVPSCVFRLFRRFTLLTLPPHLWLVLFFGLGPPDQQAKRGACSQDALMLESWLERARLLWLGRLRMVVRSASTGSVLPVVASLHIHPASETPAQLGLVLVH
jgi:hypothetical protein